MTNAAKIITASFFVLCFLVVSTNISSAQTCSVQIIPYDDAGDIGMTRQYEVKVNINGAGIDRLQFTNSDSSVASFNIQTIPNPTPGNYTLQVTGLSYGSIYIDARLFAGGTEICRSARTRHTVSPTTPVSCPISSAPGRTVVQFVNYSWDYIRGDRFIEDATLSTSANLTPGDYKVTLVSYDEHIAKGDIQNDEEYFVELKNGSGGVVATTGTISDLPSTQDWLIQEVNSSLTIPSAITLMTAKHAHFYDVNAAGSLKPVCAVFEPVGSNSCNLVLSGSSSLAQGGSGTYTAAVTGATSPIESVRFAIDSGPGNLNPLTDTFSPYSTSFSSSSIGSTTLRANAIIGGVVACEDTFTVNVTAPSCDLSLTGALSMEVGTSQNYRASVSGTAINPDEIRFSMSDPLIASVVSPDSTFPYDTVATGLTQGNTTLTAYAIYGGSIGCQRPFEITVSPAFKWWQVKEGVVAAHRNIQSRIPAACATSPICFPYLIRNELPNSPAVAVHGGTLDLYGGSVSSNGYNWNVQTSAYNQNRFAVGDLLDKSAIASATTISGSFTGNDLETVGSAHNGYVIFTYDGAAYGSQLTLTTPHPDDIINIGSRKVILLVTDANVRIERDIQLNNGEGLFLLVTTDDILIDPGIGGLQETPQAIPDLEGIYIAEGQIYTGTNGAGLDEQLHIRGMLVGYGNNGDDNGVVFERDLLDNSTIPGDLIEYAPDQVLLFPNFLSPRSIGWTEIAP